MVKRIHKMNEATPKTLREEGDIILNGVLPSTVKGDQHTVDGGISLSIHNSNKQRLKVVCTVK